MIVAVETILMIRSAAFPLVGTLVYQYLVDLSFEVKTKRADTLCISTLTVSSQTDGYKIKINK